MLTKIIDLGHHGAYINCRLYSIPVVPKDVSMSITQVFSAPAPVLDLAELKNSGASQGESDVQLLEVAPEPGKVVAAEPRLIRELTSFVPFEGHLETYQLGIFADINRPIVIANSWGENYARERGLVGYPVHISSSAEDYEAVCAGKHRLDFPLSLWNRSQRNGHNTDMIYFVIPSPNEGWAAPVISHTYARELIPLQELLERTSAAAQGIGVVLQAQERFSPVTSLEPLLFRNGMRADLQKTMVELLDEVVRDAKVLKAPEPDRRSSRAKLSFGNDHPLEIICPNIDELKDALCMVLHDPEMRFADLKAAVSEAQPSGPDFIGGEPQVLRFRQLQDTVTKIEEAAKRLSRKNAEHYIHGGEIEDPRGRENVDVLLYRLDHGFLLTFARPERNPGLAVQVHSELEKVVGLKDVCRSRQFSITVGQSKDGWSTLPLEFLTRELAMSAVSPSDERIKQFEAFGEYKGTLLKVTIGARSGQWGTNLCYRGTDNVLAALESKEQKRFSGETEFTVTVSLKGKDFTSGAGETEVLTAARDAAYRAAHKIV